MGNRAVITLAPYDENAVGIYVHWNGGQESIEGFLAAAKALGFRDPHSDCYGTARLVQVIANFFGKDGLSVGVDVNKNLDTDNGDNGVWLVGPGWTLVAEKGGAKLRKLTAADKAKRDAIAATIIAKHAATDKAKRDAIAATIIAKHAATDAVEGN